MDEIKLKALCDLITIQQIERLKADKLDCSCNIDNALTVYIIKSKYTYINIGSSGKYMIDNSTGNIYGIKAYGVIHRGHCYGNLDTIQEYYWGRYTAFKKEA